MRKHLHLVIFIASLCNVQILLACSCIAASDFCSTIANREGELSPKISIVRIVIEQNEQNVVIARMTDHLGGTLPKNNVLTINGGNGGNCIMIVSDFNVGEEYILAANYSEYHDTYSLTACGIPFLMIQNEIVTGKISGKIKQIPYHKLGEILSCQVINPTNLNQKVAVFPTITKDITNIVLNDLHSNSIKVAWDLISMDGRLIRTSDVEEYNISEKIPIDLSYLPKGIYLLRIRNEGEDFVTHKIVKTN